MSGNTRERLIDAAYDEIYERGYQAASLSDILSKAGVHKGSMYHFFANKKEMALAAISEKMSKLFNERYGSIVTLNGGYLKTFIRILKDTSLRDFRRGCPLGNLVQEMSNLDEDFDMMLKAMYANFREVIRSLLDKAVEAGEMVACDSDRLALFVTVVVEGAILSAKASGDEMDYLAAIDELAVHLQIYQKKEVGK